MNKGRAWQRPAPRLLTPTGVSYWRDWIRRVVTQPGDTVGPWLFREMPPRKHGTEVIREEGDSRRKAMTGFEGSLGSTEAVWP
jgi:hypothetical protein